MNSQTTIRFRKAYKNLPQHYKELTKKSYQLWLENPSHPSLDFKQIHTTQPIFSARIGISYRALCLKESSQVFIWFWVGSHAEYDKLIKQF